MINTSFSKTLQGIDKIIKELEETYKTFCFLTVISIDEGYVLYYSLNQNKEKSP